MCHSNVLIPNVLTYDEVYEFSVYSKKLIKYVIVNLR
jgi:hypothetical protein